MFRVSQSKLKLWRKCRRAYWYRYIEKLRRRRIARPLQFGRMVHEMLQAYANSENPFDVLDRLSLENEELFAAEREMYGEIVDDIRVIMTEYFEHYADDSLLYIRRGGRGGEHEFSLEILPQVTFEGKIDGVVKTPNKLTWLIEHKTFTNMPNEDHRWRNLQSVVYVKALQMLGWPEVDGTCWDYIRSKSPSRPQLLKSGQMSQRAIDSLPSRVIETLRDSGLDPREYETLVEGAYNNRKFYFQRIFNPIKTEVVDIVWKDFIETVEEMVRLDGKVLARNIDRHCEWCEYEPICRAELQGGDSDFVKEREFYEKNDSGSTEPAEVQEYL